MPNPLHPKPFRVQGSSALLPKTGQSKPRTWSSKPQETTWKFRGSYKRGYRSPLWVISLVTLLITPLITTTHEPPSNPEQMELLSDRVWDSWNDPVAAGLLSWIDSGSLGASVLTIISSSI